VTAKPTVTDLAIDLAAQVWHSSGTGAGAIEVAFARAPAAPYAPSTAPVPSTSSAPSTASALAAPSAPAEWVLMRVAGDPEQRVLVFDRHEWECFLDGARNGEFDAGAVPAGTASVRLGAVSAPTEVASS
jgi:hypothetical protein